MTHKISFKKLFRRAVLFFSDSFVQAIAVAALVLSALMLLIFIVERDANNGITSVLDALWYTIVTITTVGYGDITPVSVAGRAAAMVLLLSGVVIFGGLSGKAASFILDRQQKKDRGLLKMKNMKNHFLICGWKPGFEKIVEGILAANPEIPSEKVVLINQAAASEIEQLQMKENLKAVNFLRGDFTDEDMLIKAHVKSASRVIILADMSKNFSALETDSRTVLAVISIKNLNPHAYCVAEISDSKFERHLSLSRCDEIILTADYEQNLLVQASGGKGMSHILRSLTGVEGHSVLSIREIPKEMSGRTFAEYRSSLKTRDILIGVLENTGNFYERRNEALSEAQKNPNMEKIIANLKKIKQLKSNVPVFNPRDDYIIPESSKAVFILGQEEE